MKRNCVLIQFAANRPDCSQICRPLFLLCVLLCVPRLFLKQLKEQKAKTRGTLRFWKRDVSSCRVTQNQTLKVSSCKKRPDNTKDKNAIENYGVLTWNVAIITFEECRWPWWLTRKSSWLSSTGRYAVGVPCVCVFLITCETLKTCNSGRSQLLSNIIVLVITPGFRKPLLMGLYRIIFLPMYHALQYF